MRKKILFLLVMLSAGLTAWGQERGESGWERRARERYEQAWAIPPSAVYWVAPDGTMYKLEDVPDSLMTPEMRRVANREKDRPKDTLERYFGHKYGSILTWRKSYDNGDMPFRYAARIGLNSHAWIKDLEIEWKDLTPARAGELYKFNPVNEVEIRGLLKSLQRFYAGYWAAFNGGAMPDAEAAEPGVVASCEVLGYEIVRFMKEVGADDAPRYYIKVERIKKIKKRK
jgi:hypothetical protein